MLRQLLDLLIRAIIYLTFLAATGYAGGGVTGRYQRWPLDLNLAAPCGPSGLTSTLTQTCIADLGSGWGRLVASKPKDMSSCTSSETA